MVTHAIDMASGFELPDLKKTLSARVRLSTHAKLADIRELWRALAQGRGESAATVEAIDLTYVVDVLLARCADEELAQFGGYADTAEKKVAQLKVVRETAKKHAK